jgi:hypothetical protein
MNAPVVHPLLLSLLRGTDVECLMAAPAGECDWTRILEQSEQHGLTPLLHRRVREVQALLNIPHSVQEVLTGSASRVAARTLLLAEELVALLRAFASTGVRCAPLRGLALAEQLYGDITARPMGDIDLLVHPSDVMKAADVLRSLGFSEFEHRPGFARTFSYTLVFLKDRHGWVIVEPHWTIAYPPFANQIDMTAVWDQCVRTRVLGIDTWRLAAADLFLHLCWHVIHHGNRAPLLWWYELDRVLRMQTGGLDWSHVVDVARSIQPMSVGDVLRGLRECFHSPVPAGVVPRLTERLKRPKLSCRIAGASRGYAREELGQLFALSGVLAKCRYALGLLFPSPTFMRLRYKISGRWQLGFWYVRRASSLAIDSVKGLLLVASRHASRPSS